ncbi:MAG TPA: PadR family transcriptional regulator [Longimicrobiales bacterium]|nr:PadR family transcriptional regulator [Longimicrobiales bacterium]
MTERPVPLLRGTLDVMILKAVSGGSMHGYGVSRWIAETTDDTFEVQEGALYPALRRLEQKGLLESEWGVTETGREARYYTLTEAGRAGLRSEVRMWTRYVEAMSRVLRAMAPAGGGV